MSGHDESPHGFVIPVMGTGFTLDTPLRVARFGITSTVSLVDDLLMEQVRRAWHAHARLPCAPIDEPGGEGRARRVEAYLNFLKDEVDRQVERLRSQSFAADSELTRYFTLLPDSPLRRKYERMQHMRPGPERSLLECALRMSVVPGRIDVNIMAKLDRRKNLRGEALASEDSDALAALRGFANSRLHSAVVLSAGMNARLYSYLAQFDDFVANEEGRSSKSIILKVGDYRSALVQGSFLAKRGLWVSEFRIESGLNCGGHAFANGGQLLGPVLEQLRSERDALRAELFGIYASARRAHGGDVPDAAPPQRITVQGGIGTAEEDRMLRARYGVDGTGWGTPFLMVAEATAVDPETRARLRTATREQLQLTEGSPLGVPFWTLLTSESEQARIARAAEGRPGSRCPKGFLASDETLTGTPVCPASRSYQRLRLRALASSGASREERERVITKACICHDLGGAIARLYATEPAPTPAICPGPNLLYFQRELTLDELVGHIYGRCSVVAPERPHMFIAELTLNIEALRRQLREPQSELRAEKTRETLRAGVAYYLANLTIFSPSERARAESALRDALASLSTLAISA